MLDEELDARVTTFGMEDLHERIISEREARGWSQTDLAKIAGVKQQDVQRIEAGKTKTSKHLSPILEALQIAQKPPRIFVPGGRVVAQQISPEPEFFGARDLPVYACVEGGPGEIVISTDPIDMILRPWYLAKVAKAYAVIVTGDSMEPVYEAGDMVLINPRAPLIKGKDAIFASEIHGGDFKASIKRYLGSTNDFWLAKQFNPPEGQATEIRFAKAEWASAVRVVGKYTP